MTKVAVVALDACDPQIASELMASGEMPHLAQLASEGARFDLMPPTGLFVGSIWPTIATGCGPGTHGIYSWRQFEPGTYATRRMRPAEIGADPLWITLSERGARVAVVDAPLSAPDQRVNGLQIVDWGSHDRWLDTVTVDGDDVLAGRSSHPIGVRCDHSARALAPQELLDTILEGARAKGDLSIDVARSEAWDLYITVFAESHCAGHHFWQHHDPQHVDYDADKAAAFGTDPIHQIYRALDHELGRLVETFDEETVVMVLLSHGFVPHYGGEHLLNDALLRIEDAISPASRAQEAVGTTRRVHHWLGKKARSRFADGDPTIASLNGARSFFQVPNNERFGGVRLNLKGREPQGRIDADSTSGRNLIDRLEQELRLLRCPDTGRSLVTDVLRVDQLHPGPMRDRLPDLLIDWDWSAPIHAATSPTVGRVDGSYSGNRTGDHRPGGEVMISNTTRPSSAASMRTEDIAPTIASLLGERLPGVDGSTVVNSP